MLLQVLPYLALLLPQDEATRAKIVLQAAGDRLRNLKTLKATLEWTQEGTAARHPSTLYLKRPGLWRLDSTRGQSESSYVHDGKQVWSYMKTAKKYLPKIDHDHTLQSWCGPLAQLFLAPDASLLLKRTLKLGHKRQKLEDKDYDVVTYFREFDNSDAEVWIDAERKIRKIVTHSKVGGEVNAQVYHRTIEYLTEEHDPELEAELFTFTPPPDVMEMGTPRERDGTLLQLGTEAQDAEAVDTAGKKLKLSDFKGKPVVLLFWSEKAEGAADALAAFDKLRDAYKGAVFLAVNQGDAAPALKAFLQKAKPGVRVVRQKTDEISQAFGVKTLPTTYILGGDRKVALRHGGYYEERVREALDKLAPKK